MKKWSLIWVALLVFTAACDNSQQAVEEEPLKLPEKEKTWVKTEEVEITKDEALASKQATQLKAEVDPALKDKLMSASLTAGGKVTNADSCEAFLKPMEKARKTIQREGGAWHAFERNDGLRPFSDTGFQIDSNMNKLFFALRYLCQTAEGVPMTGLAITVSRWIDDKGVEGARQQMVDLGNPEAVAKEWIDYAQEARKIANRKIPYAEVEVLIARTRPLIDLYQDLLERKVDEASQQKFLTDAVTLLDVIQTRMSQEDHLAMARKEDLQVPYEKFRDDL